MQGRQHSSLMNGATSQCTRSHVLGGLSGGRTQDRERDLLSGAQFPQMGQEVASQRPPLSSPIHEMAIGHVKMHQLTSGITLPGKLLKHGGDEKMDTRSSSLSVKVALLVVLCDL